MPKFASVLVVVGLIVVSLAGIAGAGPADVPRVEGALRDDGYNRATVRCWPLPPSGSQARVSCAVTETTIKTPDRAAIAQSLTEIQKASNAEILKGCSDVVAAKIPGFDAHDQAIVDALASSCSAKDAAGLRKAMIAMAQDIAPVSCSVETFLWQDLEIFQQVDGNTWIESSGPTGTCHITATLTLARKSAADAWGLGLAETSPGNSSDPQCKFTTNHRWLPDLNAGTKTGCKYVN
jgi:hypothetical protein